MSHSCKHSVFLQARSEAPKSSFENEKHTISGHLWELAFHVIYLVRSRIVWQRKARVKSNYWGQDSSILESSLSKSTAFWFIQETNISCKWHLKILLFLPIWKDVAASSDTHCLFDCCKFFYLSIPLDAHTPWPPVSPPPQSVSNVNSDKQKYWSELTAVLSFSLHLWNQQNPTSFQRLKSFFVCSFYIKSFFPSFVWSSLFFLTYFSIWGTLSPS